MSSHTLKTKKPLCNSVCNESKNILYSWFCSHVHNVPTHPILTYHPGAKRKAKLFCHHKGVGDTCGKWNSIQLKRFFSFFYVGERTTLVSSMQSEMQLAVDCSYSRKQTSLTIWGLWVLHYNPVTNSKSYCSCMYIKPNLNLVGTEG